MNARGVLRHAGRVLAGVFVILGLPFMASGTFRSIVRGEGVDLISGATVIIDRPSGEYIVMINETRTNAENLEKWITFFEGGDAGYIFEDISCSVSRSDPGAVEMARSYQSRLPENQMTLRLEDGTLLLSRADSGKFGIIILSQEYAEACGAQSAYASNVEVVTVEELDIIECTGGSGYADDAEYTDSAAYTDSAEDMDGTANSDTIKHTGGAEYTDGVRYIDDAGDVDNAKHTGSVAYTDDAAYTGSADTDGTANMAPIKCADGARYTDDAEYTEGAENADGTADAHIIEDTDGTSQLFDTREPASGRGMAV